MLKRIFLLALCALCTGTANARLGETLDQCKARYGEPIPIYTADAYDLFDTYLFSKGAYRISIVFIDGVAIQIVYRKDLGSRLNDLEVKNLLNLQGPGWTQWKEDSWYNDTMYAIYMGHNDERWSLTIETYHGLDLIKAALAQEAQKSQEGL